ncbi:MAG: hypothetical protein H8E62_06130, partial [Planctomycetes bacterium]|nr:hypothetical protein [Planctomycetota bacterium]
MQSKTKIMLLLVGLQSITAFARPPKVVKMYPENGAPNVKPGPIKIRILFDQDMSSGGHSLCGGGDGFPEIVGKPKWASRRVFVFSAHLEADHDYSFSVNCTSAQNFKSVRGEPAEILFVQFRTAGTGEEPSKSASSETKSHNQQAVQNLRGAIDNAYSYKDLKGIDWEKLFNRYSKSLSNAANAKDFAKNAALMLAHAKDKHIWLKANGEHISVYRNPVTPNANLKLLPKLVPDFKKHNANVSTGRFADGIGYIYIDSWSRHEIKDFDQLYTALKKFSDAPGLIIDVRGNGGGSET